MVSIRCVLFIVDSNTVNANELPITDEILITSQQPERFLNSTAAEIKVISGEDISRLNAHSIPEILETIASVDLVEKGTPGSQADIAINGSSIEGVLVLINGIRVHDPQTGHFTMDIPVDLSSVERIEIMTGGGSSIYGSSASGGVINIVTKMKSEGVLGSVSMGSYRSRKLNMSFAKKFSRSNISLFLRGGRSDGYRESSNMEYTGAYVTGSYDSDDWFVKWNIGLINKKFGAGNFFAPYPAFEKTLTVQGGFNATRIIDDRKIIRFRVGSRGHGDDFLIKKEDLDTSEDYHNTHYNRTYSFAAEYLSDIYDSMFFLMGAETERMGITSGSLGNHSDCNNSVYGEFSATIKKSLLSISIRLDNGSREKNIFSPGCGLVVPLNNNSRFKIRAEKSFRSPTYTDLYYKSPSNRGNPSLKSEHSSSINTGFDVAGENAEFGVSFFARETTNAIDWVRDNKASIWTVENHGHLVTNGVEMKCLFAIFKNWKSSFNATILNQSVKKRKGMESKYTLNPLSKSFSAIMTGRFFSNIKCAFITKFEEQLQGGSRTPVSVRISRNLGSINTVVSVRNIFNEQYEEIPGLPAPGRWFDLRMEYVIDAQ